MINWPTDSSAIMNLHLDGLIPPTAHNLVSHEIHAVDFIRMPRQIDSNLECLQIPELFTRQ